MERVLIPTISAVVHLNVPAPRTSEQWAQVFHDNRHEFTSPEAAAETLAGLHAWISWHWPLEKIEMGQGCDTWEPGTVYASYEAAFLTGAQNALGVQVRIGEDKMLRLRGGKQGWQLASAHLPSATPVALQAARPSASNDNPSITFKRGGHFLDPRETNLFGNR